MVKTLKNSSDANRRRKIFKVLLVIGIVVLISTSCLTQTQIHPLATSTASLRASSSPSPYATVTVPSERSSPSAPISPTPSYAPLVCASPTVALPTATPIATNVNEPPPCTFPLPQTTTEESLPENYSFSEPKVMITDEHAAFDIVQWLPDSQRALIVRDVIKKGYEQYNSIELFNPRTVKVQVYAQPKYSMYPSWIPGLDGILYPGTRVIKPYFNSANGTYNPSTAVSEQLLSISNGDPNKVQNIEEQQYTPFIFPHEWIISSLAVKPDGSQIVYLKTNGNHLFQLYSRDVSQGSLGVGQLIPQLIPFDTSQSAAPQLLYEMAWRPDSSQILFYSSNSSNDHTFLFDDNTGEVCELSFQNYVYAARWSSNGRYLAVLIAPRNFPYPNDVDLAVLDTVTGKLYPIDATKLISPYRADQGGHDVSDIAWAPDNRHLIAIGTLFCAGSSCWQPESFLYLIDFISGKVNPLFPSEQFDDSFPNTGLAWSPDGSKVLALCRGLCLISVHRTGQ
jgi:hypothetical protein